MDKMRTEPCATQYSTTLLQFLDNVTLTSFCATTSCVLLWSWCVTPMMTVETTLMRCTVIWMNALCKGDVTTFVLTEQLVMSANVMQDTDPKKKMLISVKILMSVWRVNHVHKSVPTHLDPTSVPAFLDTFSHLTWKAARQTALRL